jgi:hypothetical protein
VSIDCVDSAATAGELDERKVINGNGSGGGPTGSANHGIENKRSAVSNGALSLEHRLEKDLAQRGCGQLSQRARKGRIAFYGWRVGKS